MKIQLAQINPTVADFSGNLKKVIDGIERAKTSGADLVVFPELCLLGYPPEDFLLLTPFVEQGLQALDEVVEASSNIGVIVGVARFHGNPKEKHLCNSAAVIYNKELLGFQDKAHLPTYDVFDERRYFDSGEEMKVFSIAGKRVGITICEDVWQQSAFASYSYDPIMDLKGKNPDVHVNLSASPYSSHKLEKRIKALSKASLKLDCPSVLCNQVGGNDNLIFDGYSLYVGKDGRLRDIAKGFQEDDLLVDLDKELPEKKIEIDRMEDLFSALVLGLKDYFQKSGFSKALFGLSGGIDSAVVACVAAKALGSENVLAVMLPSRFSTKESLSHAKELASNLGIETKEISIEGPFQSLLDLLAPEFGSRPFDITEENMQARIRGMILMALSNKLGHIVLSTGNKSEMAMGYATLYGDMVGGLGILSDVTKEDVYNLARWLQEIPQAIIDKPPSAELRDNQKDSDSLPPYDIVDNVLKAYVEEHDSPEEIAKTFGYDLDLVKDLVAKIHRNEYKRRQSAPGLRVTEKAFSAGYRFPIVQKYT